MKEDRNLTVGKCFIGNKEIYRIVVSPKDYTPLCFHKHESAEEALGCEEALKKLNLVDLDS